MDTFMEKLAQKYNAQDMINANSAAEAEELDKMRERIEEYNQCLSRMKEICAEFEETAQTARDKVDSANIRTESLREELLAIWKEMKEEQKAQIAQIAQPAARDAESAVIATETFLSSADDVDFSALFENLKENIRDMQESQTDEIKTLLQSSQGVAPVESAGGLTEEQMDELRSLVQGSQSTAGGLTEAQMDELRDLVQNIQIAQPAPVESYPASAGGLTEAQMDELRDLLQNIQIAQPAPTESYPASAGGLTEAQMDELRDLVQNIQIAQPVPVESYPASAGGLTEEQMDELRSLVQSSPSTAGGLTEAQMDELRSLLQNIQIAQPAQTGDSVESAGGFPLSQMDELRSMQAESFTNIRAAMDDQVDAMRSMLKVQLSNLKKEEAPAPASAPDLDLKGSLDAGVEEMKNSLGGLFENSNEFTHKECVKVYRNVQAVIGEENNKLGENLEFLIKPMDKKIGGAKTMALLAMLFSLAGVALQVVNMLHLI